MERAPREGLNRLSRRHLLRSVLAGAGAAGLFSIAACAPAPPAATQPPPGGPTPAPKPTQPAAPTAAGQPATATQAPATSAQPKTLRFVWLGDLTPLWHPSQYETFGQAVVFSLIFNNLVKIDEDLKTIIPDLAERWEVSPDATQFTFHLNKAARWQDGTPVTAKDVAFSFSSQLVNPTLRPARMLALKGADDYKAGKTDKVAGIEQLDDSTVRLTLTDPDATFLVDLREPEQVIVPEHILKDVKPDALKSHAFVLKSPVGSGPYKFVQYVTDQNVEFDVNPDYFKGRPKIDKIFMKRLTPDVTVAQLESGEVDLALRLNPVEYERLSKLATLNVISRPGVGMTAMNFPVEQPRVADKRVRQGIYNAVDRKGIVAAVFQGRAKVLNGAPPALDGYQDLNAYDYNPDKGKQLLTDAGFDFSKPVRIIYDQTYPAAPQYYPIIGQQLQKIGLTVELNAMDSTAFIARSQKERETFEIFGSHGGNQGLHPNLTAAYFDCKRQGFGTAYTNCDMDALFVKARATADATQRDDIYHQIARILNEDTPQLPLWTPNDLHGAVKALGGGFSVYGDPRSSFGKVETWTLG